MPYSTKIFLAEDDSDDIVFFQEALLLIYSNFQLRIFHNGEDLLETLGRPAAFLPDVIFLDSSLPLYDGMETLHELKKIPALSLIPVIIMAVSDLPDYIDEAYRLGAHFYFIKPYNFPALKDHLQKLLSINWEKHPYPTNRDEFLIY